MRQEWTKRGGVRGRGGRGGVLRAASLALGMVAAATPALAQVGEVEALRQQIESMRKGMELLENRLEELAGREAGTAARIDAVEESGRSVPERLVTSGRDDVQLSISGHINRGLLIANDGDSTEVFHVDNSFSGSRVRFEGSARFTEDISAGTNLEVQLRTNRSDRVNQIDNEPIGQTSFDRRKVEFYFDSESLGRIWVGQGSTASDGITGSDLSGTTVIQENAVQDFAGGILFFDGNTNALSDTQVRQAFDDLDGLSRRDRLRYDTPVVGGFMLSGSLIRNGGADIALRYGTTVNGVRFAASGAFASAITEDNEQIAAGSASVLLPSGFNATVAAGTALQREAGRDDPTYIYGKLGYRFAAFDFGGSALSVDYYEGWDMDRNEDTSRSVGLAAVQTVDRLGTELYLGLRGYDLDRAGADFDPVVAALSGARVRF